MERDNSYRSVEKNVLDAFLSGSEAGARLFLQEYGGIIKDAVRKIGLKDNMITHDDLFWGALAHIAKNDKKAIRDFKGKSKFSTYLYFICRRYALKESGVNNGAKPVIWSQLPSDNLLHSIEEEQETWSEEQMEAIKPAVELLDKNSQLFIRMMFYDKIPTKEIMHFFGWKNETPVYTKKHKVISKLKKNVKRILLSRK